MALSSPTRMEPASGSVRSQPVAVSIEITRERVVQALCAHYAQDRLTTEELESRLARAQKASSEPQLASLVIDLPALPDVSIPGVMGAMPAPSYAPAVTASRSVPTPPSSWPLVDLGPRVRHDVTRQDSQHYTSIMSGVVRKGVWVPAHDIQCFVVMGGAEFDFREAILAPGVTEINIFVMMGGVEILIPPGVRIEQDGTGFMGAFDESGSSSVPIGPDAPVIRITGFAFMGGVDIQVRYPGESRSDAKRREKEEKKRLRG